LELKQQLKMSQQLVMTPQLQQAIKLLQMSRMELVETVHQEMLENPVLEETPENQEPSTEGASQSADGDSGPEPTAQSTSASENESESEPEPSNGEGEIDWERYMENHANQAPMPGGGVRAGGDELPGIEATVATSQDLVDHLEWQLHMGEFLDEELRFAALVFGNLDDRGYLTMEGMAPAEVVPKLAEEAQLDPEDAEEVLSMIQQMDPVGVAARDVSECLLIQAKHFDMDALALRVLAEHLTNLERKNYNAIAKALQVEVEEIYDIAQAIMDLEPRPARNFVTSEAQYIVPDVSVQKIGDEYVVVANDDGMPKLRISGFYRSAMKGDPQAKEYIQNKLRSAQWLIRSIDQRRRTIERVTECIVAKQHDFFEKGIEHLKPMILRDVAEEVGMHESTISRVTSNKYVATPRGTLELKYFFNSAIRRGSSAEDIASESVKQAIKKFIEGEEPTKPYSDQKLVELLREQNVVIARRTVAKYREMMGIVSSSKRKKYF